MARPTDRAFNLFERLQDAIPADARVGDIIDALGMLAGVAMAECPDDRLGAVGERLGECASVGRRCMSAKLRKVRTTEMPAGECRGCGGSLNAATALDGSTPSEGDASICIECGTLAIWTGDGRLRVPTDAERNQLLRQPDVQVALAAVMKVKASGAG